MYARSGLEEGWMIKLKYRSTEEASYDYAVARIFYHLKSRVIVTVLMSTTN